MRFLLFVFLGVSTLFSFEIKINDILKTVEYKYENEEYITSQNLSFTNSSNLMIKFKVITPELINEFENRYELELISVLVSGYYVYKVGEGRSIDTLSAILVDDSNIYTLVPAWKTKVQKK